MNNHNTVISIFCNNIHQSNHITHAILQSQASPTSNTEIVIITKPWISTICTQTQKKGTVNHPDWWCVTPTNIQEADVIIYYQMNSKFRVTIGDNFPIMLMAIYNSPSTFAATTLLQYVNMPEEPMILCRDFNLYSPDWTILLKKQITELTHSRTGLPTTDSMY